MRSAEVMRGATREHDESHDEDKPDQPDPTLEFMLGLMIAIVLVGIALTLAINWQVGFGVMVILSAIIWKLSLHEIPATPPTVGILKFMGKPLRVLKERGMRLIPLRGFMFGFDIIELDVSAQELEIKDLVLTTPTDGVQTPPVKMAVTWRPDTSRAGSLTDFQDYSHGGHPEEISDFLKELIVERARNYANSPVEGPQTIEELVRSTRGLNHAVLKALCADDIEPCSSDVPTEVLMDYFHNPNMPSIPSFAAEWGEHWGRVKEILSHEDEAKIREEIRTRQMLLERVMSGRGEVRVNWLGIVIEKIAVEEIKEPAELARARLLKKEADEQNEADKRRLAALRRRLASFMGVRPEEVKLSREQAVSFVASGGKLEKWNLNETRQTHEVGSGLAGVLERIGLKVNIEAANNGGGGRS